VSHRPAGTATAYDARVLRVGLTGGIGAGKSTVATRLAELGAVVIDADRVAREVVEPGTPGLAAVVEAFGDGVLRPDGTLDRPALGRLVFAEDDRRRTLNGILHPLIGARTGELMAEVAPDAVVVHDVPLLVENGLDSAYHLVIVVHAPERMRVERLVAHRGMTEEDAWARVRAQATDEERRAAADVWIDNSGTREATVAQVDECWHERIVWMAEDPPD
jgi:dephospho-CoA kinase